MRFNFYRIVIDTNLIRFNLDDITKENDKEHNKNGHIFQIIFTEF